MTTRFIRNLSFKELLISKIPETDSNFISDEEIKKYHIDDMTEEEFKRYVESEIEKSSKK